MGRLKTWAFKVWPDLEVAWELFTLQMQTDVKQKVFALSKTEVVIIMTAWIASMAFLGWIAWKAITYIWFKN